MAAPLNKLPPGFILDEPDSAGLPPGFTLDAPAAAPEESMTEQMLGGGAASLDLLAQSAVGAANWLGYPIRRVLGPITGETPESIAASQERVATATATPVGDVLGVTETPSYARNPAKQAMEYVGGLMDAGAETIANTFNIPKSDAVNMMQSAAAIVPLKVPGGKTAGRVAKAGVNKLADIVDPKTAFYMDLAEGRGAELVQAARRPEQTVLPGVKPTFAQATADVGMPRIAAVGEEAKTLPTTATTAQALKDAQEAARVRQLEIIERSPKSRARAEEVRSRRSDPLYEAAETAGDVVDVAPTLDYIDDLMRTNPGNDSLLAALRTIRKGLTKTETRQQIVTDAKGKMKTVDVKVQVPRVNAQEISSSITGIKTALADEKNKLIKGELTNIKDDLTAAIPSMKEADLAFKKGSRTLNQRDMATYLKEKLTSALPEGPQRAAAFAQAVRDAPRTIKTALDGAPPYQTFTEAGMTPAQTALIDRVVIDLSREARVKELAQAGAEAAPKLKKAGPAMSLPPLLERAATIANEILKRLQGKVSDKIAADIAMEFLDADRAAAALETAMRRTAKREAVGSVVMAPPRAAAKGYRAVEPGVRAGVVTSPNQMGQENRNRMAR